VGKVGEKVGEDWVGEDDKYLEWLCIVLLYSSQLPDAQFT
jgi:hypothetical protein